MGPVHHADTMAVRACSGGTATPCLLGCVGCPHHHQQQQQQQRQRERVHPDRQKPQSCSNQREQHSQCQLASMQQRLALKLSQTGGAGAQPHVQQQGSRQQQSNS